MSLLGCEHCGGFVIVRARVCPHCDTALPPVGLRRLGRRVAIVATGGAVAMTLMACYGGPPEGYGAKGGSTAGASGTTSSSATPATSVKPK